MFCYRNFHYVCENHTFMKKLISILTLLLIISSCEKINQTTFKVVVTSSNISTGNVIITSDKYPVNTPQAFIDQSLSNFSYEWKESKKTTIRVQVGYPSNVDYPNYKIELYKKGKLVKEASNNYLEWKY